MENTHTKPQPAPRLTMAAIARMIDLSAVRADSTDAAVDQAVWAAQHYHCYLVTVLPAQISRVKQMLCGFAGGASAVKLGGNVGFPSGGQTTSIKVLETCQLVDLGVDEIDVVMDIAAHLSGRYDQVYQDLRAVVEAAGPKPVKVILECHYLDETHIRLGCDLAIRAGAAFVKTSTGWAPTGATPANVTLIKQHVGEAIAIKAAGGIRDLPTLLTLYDCGATRFGISRLAGAAILETAVGSGAG